MSRSSLFDGMIKAAASLINEDDMHTNPEYVRGMAELIAVCMEMSVGVAEGREYVTEAIRHEVVA